MPILNQRAISSHQLVVNVYCHVFAHVDRLAGRVFPLRIQLDSNPLLTSSFACDCIPSIAAPPSPCPLDLIDCIRLCRPLLHVGECLDSAQELLLAVRLEVGRLARCGRLGDRRFADDPDGALSLWCHELVFERLNAGLAC